MKRLFAIIVFLGVGVFAFAQDSTVPKDTAKAPSFKFKEETWDFGEIPQGTPVTHSFEFKNIGMKPLVISMVDKSCGCTTPKWTTEPVLPNKTGYVSATFNAAGAGEFAKTVTIHSNAKQENKILTIKGKVIQKPAEEPKQTQNQNNSPH